MRSLALGLIAASLVCAGCSQAGAGPNTPEPRPTAGASGDPATEPPASPAPVTEPPVTAPTITGPSMGEPPAASLAVEGGDPVVGRLGSFTWDNSGSDSPALGGNPIHVGAGERLTLTLAEPVGIENWTASRRPAGGPGHVGVVGLGEATGGRVTFDAPPPGAWSVHVSVWFVDNRGSAVYFWLMTVD